MLHHKSFGIPPLGGIAGYDEAARPGLSVDRNVTLLKRYAYTERRLMEIVSAHLCSVPEWEVKCALSLHCWLDAEHAGMLRQRIAEMREPPLHLDEAPDAELAAFLEEALQACDTAERRTGLYRVVEPALASAYQQHLVQTNPLADHPTCRQLRAIQAKEEEMIAWGEAALAAVLTTLQMQERATLWAEHLGAWLKAAVGIWGDPVAPGGAVPPRRATRPFVVAVMPEELSRSVATDEQKDGRNG